MSWTVLGTPRSQHGSRSRAEARGLNSAVVFFQILSENGSQMGVPIFRYFFENFVLGRLKTASKAQNLKNRVLERVPFRGQFRNEFWIGF